MGLRPTFTFLDPHHILVGFLWSNESQSQPRDLLVCALDPSLRLHGDSDPFSSAVTVQLNTVSTYRFRIPKLLKRRDFWEIHTHRNSVPLLPNTTSAAPHYFDNDPADQLVVIEMASRRRNPQPDKPDPALSLCIPARVILRRIITQHNTPSRQQPLVFAWEQWGEGNVLVERRFDIERRLPALSRVCGLRHAARKPIIRTDGLPAMFHVVDFHPGRASRIARSRAAAEGPSSSLGAVVEVPLPVEMQSVDPALISTSICQDALIAFEVRCLNFYRISGFSFAYNMAANGPRYWWYEKRVCVFVLRPQCFLLLFALLFCFFLCSRTLSSCSHSVLSPSPSLCMMFLVRQPPFISMS